MSMRLYRNQISKLSDMIIRVLTEENEIVEIAKRQMPTEEESRSVTWSNSRGGRRDPFEDTQSDLMINEFRQDIRAVLNNYVNTDRRLTDEARKAASGELGWCAL